MKLVNDSGLLLHRMNNKILCSKFLLNFRCAKSFCRNEAVNVNILLVTTLKESKLSGICVVEITSIQMVDLLNSPGGKACS